LAYEWDVFVSYPREGQVGRWVHNHFLPLLRDCLESTLAHQPRVFIDAEMPTGGVWPQQLKQALLHSQLLIPVWTPPFFRSRWCMAEWESMLAREIVLGEAVPPRGLVYPVVYSDGDHFAQRAKQTQYKRSLSAFTYPFPGFRDSATYLPFHDAMMEMAAEIEAHLATIPPWQPDWPTVEPVIDDAPPIALARL